MECPALSQRLADAHHFACRNLMQAQLLQKRDYDLRLAEHRNNEGDIVYKLESST
jgi:hypothetical protein